MINANKFFLAFAALGVTLQAVAFPGGVSVDLVAALVFVLFYFARHGLMLRRIDLWLLLWLLVMIIGGVVGIASNEYFDIFRYLSHALRMVVYFLFFMALRESLASSHVNRTYMLKVILAIGLIHGLYGVYQFIGLQYGLPLTDLRVLQADKPVTRAIGDLFINRPYGTFREPSNFGGFLIYWIFLTAAVAKIYGYFSRYIVFISLMLVISCLLTISRGAIVSALLAILIMAVSGLLIKGGRRKFLIVSGLLGGFVMIVLVSPPIFISYLLQVFSGEGDESIVTRWSTYSIFLENMNNWVLGSGLGQFELMHYVYEGVIWGPQSGYVYVVTNTGLLGLLCYVAIISTVLWRGHYTDPQTWFLRGALLAGLIHSFSFLGVTTALHWFVFAIIYVFASNPAGVNSRVKVGQ